MQIATIDCLVENIHFKMDTATWEDIGWKALAVNLSDIAAMGGQPRYALISLTLPRSLLLENIIELYRGIILIANQYHVAIVGGNISSSSLLTVHVTLLGSSIENRLLTRSSAKPGDVIGLTGYTGLSAGKHFEASASKTSAESQGGTIARTGRYCHCYRY
jgi:thiamine-monophosphate kinase